jgi:hypothetical protein
MTRLKLCRAGLPAALATLALWFALWLRLGRLRLGRLRLADDAARGADRELFELVGLAPGPRDELVKAPGVEPRVGVRLGQQRAPAGRLTLDAQPQQFEFLQVAQR